jgi:RNA polymerase sigma-70 factor (ECF subfamily)
MSDGLTTQEIQRHLDSLRHTGAESVAARDRLLEAACDRLRRLARQMLRYYPAVQAHEQTDDVLNSAVIRLMRPLGDDQVLAHMESARDFLRLAAAQVRRELIDLARHYASANAPPRAGGPGAGDSSLPEGEPSESTFDPPTLALWAEFHRFAGELPDDERAAFDLVWYQDMSKVEAADVLGVDESTVRRRLQSAQRHLYDRLGGRLPF